MNCMNLLLHDFQAKRPNVSQRNIHILGYSRMFLFEIGFVIVLVRIAVLPFLLQGHVLEML